MSKESGFLRWNLLLVKTVEMTTKDLEYYVDLIDKAGQGLQELTPILKEVLLCVKWYQMALPRTEK